MTKEQLETLVIDIDNGHSAKVSILGRELNYTPYFPVVSGSTSIVNLGRIKKDMKEAYPDFEFPEIVKVSLSYPSNL